MNLTPPTSATFAVGVALLIIGVLLHIDILNLPDLRPYAYWITFAGGVILAAGAAFRQI
jgi:hypothetical protein